MQKKTIYFLLILISISCEQNNNIKTYRLPKNIINDNFSQKENQRLGTSDFKWDVAFACKGRDWIWGEIHYRDLRERFRNRRRTHHLENEAKWPVLVF